MSGGKNTLIFENISSFDPDQTFNCGQCFRWDKCGDSYRGFVGEVPCRIYRDGANLCVEPLCEIPDRAEFEKFVRRYLAIDTDYDAIKQKFSQDETMKKAIAYGEGIRVLNQPFFETLITFIISQNNNIPRIKKLVDALSQKYGKKIGDMYAFPTARRLKDVTEREYSELRVGFRAKYIYDAVQKVNSGRINEKTAKELPYDDAVKYLCQIKGVGPKVADCVLLFSCEKYDALPKDVWIKRALREMFPNGLPECIRGLEGIAQQYIFQYARYNLDK